MLDEHRPLMHILVRPVPFESTPPQGTQVMPSCPRHAQRPLQPRCRIARSNNRGLQSVELAKVSPTPNRGLRGRFGSRNHFKGQQHSNNSHRGHPWMLHHNRMYSSLLKTGLMLTRPICTIVGGKLERTRMSPAKMFPEGLTGPEAGLRGLPPMSGSHLTLLPRTNR